MILLCKDMINFILLPAYYNEKLGIPARIGAMINCQNKLLLKSFHELHNIEYDENIRERFVKPYLLVLEELENHKKKRRLSMLY